MSDKRGSHSNRNNTINCDYWTILDDWLKDIPKTTSHYKYESVMKSYFENSELTITKLYNLSYDILTAEYGFEQKISFNTFRNYFYDNYNIGFSHKKSDVCDLCYECHKIGISKLTDEMKINYENHKQLLIDYRNLKSNLMKP